LGFGGNIANIAVFVAWQFYKGDQALIPMNLLFRQTVVFSSLTAIFALGGIFAVVYYLLGGSKLPRTLLPYTAE